MEKGRPWGPVALGAGAVAVAALTARGQGLELDRRLYRSMNRSRGPQADAFLKGLTELGSIMASASAAVVLTRAGKRREGLDAFGAAAAMWVLGQIAKKAVLRPRPYHAMRDVRLLVEEPKGTSWPSSHPAVLLAFVTVAGRDLGLSRRSLRAMAGVAWLVGFSRVYVGVHYPSDVLGGLLLARGLADAWSRLLSPWAATVRT